jgi:hypothetical protein
MVSEIRMEIRMEAPSGVRGKSVSSGVKQVNQRAFGSGRISFDNDDISGA